MLSDILLIAIMLLCAVNTAAWVSMVLGSVKRPEKEAEKADEVIKEVKPHKDNPDSVLEDNINRYNGTSAGQRRIK